jgi:hypothetical protein
MKVETKSKGIGGRDQRKRRYRQNVVMGWIQGQSAESNVWEENGFSGGRHELWRMPVYYDIGQSMVRFQYNSILQNLYCDQRRS